MSYFIFYFLFKNSNTSNLCKRPQSFQVYFACDFFKYPGTRAVVLVIKVADVSV